MFDGQRNVWQVLLTLMAIVAASTQVLAEEDRDSSAAAQGAHVFEQRVYTTADGKLPDLHARFRNHTNYLFVKHGMQLIGFWTPVEKPNTLIYILAYPNMDARGIVEGIYGRSGVAAGMGRVQGEGGGHDCDARGIDVHASHGLLSVAVARRKKGLSRIGTGGFTNLLLRDEGDRQPKTR